MTKRTLKPKKSVKTTKAARITTLLRRKAGASIDELKEATGWQAHSVRGYLSGSLRKKQGLAIASTRADGKHLRYFIGGGDK